MENTDRDLSELPQYLDFAGQVEIYCARILNDRERARDVVHEVFIRFLEGGRGHEGNIRAWLYRVARNLCIDHLRKNSRYVSLEDTEILYSRDGDNPAEVVGRNEQRDIMIENLTKLPPKQQEVLRLKFQEEMSYAQIAEVTGDTITTVGWNLHQAIKTLRGSMAALQ